jgi:hypothetical protein
MVDLVLALDVEGNPIPGLFGSEEDFAIEAGRITPLSNTDGDAGLPLRSPLALGAVFE